MTYPVLTLEDGALRPAPHEAVHAYTKDRNYIDHSPIEAVIVFDRNRSFQFAQDRVTGDLYLLVLKPQGETV
jgi:hypothetical protein